MWYPDRESNPDLLFRRELFYPLNYQSPYVSLRSWCGGWCLVVSAVMPSRHLGRDVSGGVWG